MTWTKKWPKEEGWYWFSNPDSLGGKVQVAQARLAGPEDRRFWMYVRSGAFIYPNEFRYGCWWKKMEHPPEPPNETPEQWRARMSEAFRGKTEEERKELLSLEGRNWEHMTQQFFCPICDKWLDPTEEERRYGTDKMHREHAKRLHDDKYIPEKRRTYRWNEGGKKGAWVND